MVYRLQLLLAFFCVLSCVASHPQHRQGIKAGGAYSPHSRALHHDIGVDIPPAQGDVQLEQRDPKPVPLPKPPPTPQILNNGSAVICRTGGPCEKCPESSLSEPFCQPYGNRRLIKCIPKTFENERLMEKFLEQQRKGIVAPGPSSSAGGNRFGKLKNLLPGGDRKGGEEAVTLPPETPAWEACGRVVAVERADFWEFLACIVFFACLSSFVIVVQSRKLAAIQYRKLAARIGIRA